jgi:microcystin-dependent protein
MRATRVKGYSYVGNGDAEPLLASKIRESTSWGWRMVTVLGVLGAICAATLAVVGLAYAYTAWQGQGAQTTRSNQLESTLVSAQTALSGADALLDARISLVNTTLCDKIMGVNNTLNQELDLINGFLNITNGTFSQFLQSAIQSQLAPLASDTATLQTQINQRIATIDNVPGANGTQNVDLVAGIGIDITPNIPGNSILFENTGVVTVNGVPSGNVAPGQLEILGIGMISIINDANTSQETVDGGAIVTTLVNLQNENSMQMIDIQTLQNTTSQLQLQLNAVQMTGNMIADALNGTTIELNMTIMTLINQVFMDEMRITVLENQLANLTAVATPTGTLVPWSGTNLNVPSGYLLADGTEYSQALYPDLFTVINTMYCPGPCTIGMFAVPDMRGRVPVGRAASGQFNVAVGVVVGVETNTLTTNELPAHTHSGSTTGGGGHQHTFEVSLDQDNAYNPISGSDCQVANHIQVANCGGVVSPKYVKMQLPTEFPPFDITSAELFGDHQHTFTTASSGLGAAFTNVQPSVVMHYMIKT